jgi:hypothetical protein
MDTEQLCALISTIVFTVHAAIAHIAEEEVRMQECDRLLLDYGGGLGRVREEMSTSINAAAFHHLRSLNSASGCSEGDRWWVKCHSITWFEQFALTEYDDHRWIELFRMSKATLLRISERVHPIIGKDDTNFRSCVPTRTRVAAALFKIAHNAHLVIVTELFGLGRSIVGTILREVVGAINIVFGDLIRWPEGGDMQDVVSEFFAFSGMPSVHGAIDYTHISIAKPKICPEDYFYYKHGAYTMVLQGVVDAQKRFTDIFVSLPRSVNDSRILKKSGLHRRVVNGGLINDDLPHIGDIPPYILGDKGYPLLPWLLTPFKDDGRQRTYLESLYQEQHSRGRSVIENAFGILKQTWRELLVKTDMKVEFVPDLVSCCCVLHNMILATAAPDIDYLCGVLEEEGRMDALHPRRPRVHQRFLQRPHGPVAAEREDGRGLQ